MDELPQSFENGVKASDPGWERPVLTRDPGPSALTDALCLFAKW